MMRGRIVPIHQQRAIPGIEIVPNKPAGIGLLVDERERGRDTQKPSVAIIADLEIFFDHAGGNERPDQLCVTRPDELDFPLLGQLAKTGDPIRIAGLDLFERITGCFDTDRAVRRGEGEKGPVAALDDGRSFAFLDRGKGAIEMKDREEMKRRGCCRRGRRRKRRQGFANRTHVRHCISISIAAIAAFAEARAASREAPVASTIAADGRLSPAGGMMSPWRAVTTMSAMPGRRLAASAPRIPSTRPGLGKA